jgi:hypothetical protein
MTQEMETAKITDCGTLIERVTGGLVNRQWVPKTIDRFLDTASQGNLHYFHYYNAGRHPRPRAVAAPSSGRCRCGRCCLWTLAECPRRQTRRWAAICGPVPSQAAANSDMWTTGSASPSR